MKNNYFIGDVIYPINGLFKSKGLQHTQLYYQGPGESTLIVDGQKFYATEGTTYIMYAKKTYEIQFSKHTESTHYWITFKDSINIEKKIKPLNRKNFIWKNNEVFKAYFLLALKLRDNAIYTESEYNFLLHFLDLFIEYSLNYSGGSNKCNGKVWNALRFMQQNYSQHLQLFDIASHCNTSIEHLIRLFKKEGYESPKQELQKIRTQKAIGLIRDTNLSFQEICDSIGIKDIYQFSKIIKKVTGRTPKSIRNNEQ